MKKMAVSLWFDNQAEDATKFYQGVFKHTKPGSIARYTQAGAKMSGQKEGSVMTVQENVENIEIVALNGGPLFKFNPSYSFYVGCETESEISELWSKLSPGGQVRMGLDKYPWAERYGWTTDKYGVEWQLILAPTSKKISPAFLFTDELFGRGQEAVAFYTSIFPDSKINMMAKDEKTKSIMHCSFTLNGENFVLMEGAGQHGHKFNESFSIVVYCENQKEIDDYWSKLIAGGGKESQCGWLKDKFGVSWQIVPRMLPELAADPKKADKAMAAVGQMKKFDLAALKAAIQ